MTDLGALDGSWRCNRTPMRRMVAADAGRAGAGGAPFTPSHGVAVTVTNGLRRDCRSECISAARNARVHGGIFSDMRDGDARPWQTFVAWRLHQTSIWKGMMHDLEGAA